MLTQRIVALADGAPVVDAAEAYASCLTEIWDRVSGIGMTDEEWYRAGEVANAFLDAADKNLIELFQRDDLLDAKTATAIAAIEDPAAAASMTNLFERWKVADEATRLRESRAFAIETWRLSPAAAERLDAHVCCAALRIREAARGARVPKKNDGADVSLTIHLGEGCILVTQEEQLLKIVDASETFQSPWVRHLENLDDLPDGEPWGESARRQAQSFRRRRSRC